MKEPHEIDLPHEASDPISPNHYQLTLANGTKVETIQILEAVLAGEGFDEFEFHCLATALAYLVRAPRKNGIEDIRKARQYLTFILTHREEPL